jgi:hypothetical protein
MRKQMMGVLAAGLATASLVAVTTSAEARWQGRGGWSGGGARVVSYGGGWRGGYGGYHRGWGGGGLAAGAVLGAVTGAALASSYGYGGYGGYDGYYDGYAYAPVSYGYAPAAYAYPAASYYEEYPTTVSYAVPAYRARRVVHRVAYYPQRAYRTVRVVAPRRAIYRSAYRSGFRAAAYGGPARGHFVRSHVVRHRWH